MSEQPQTIQPTPIRIKVHTPQSQTEDERINKKLSNLETHIQDFKRTLEDLRAEERKVGLLERIVYAILRLFNFLFGTKFSLATYQTMKAPETPKEQIKTATEAPQTAREKLLEQPAGDKAAQAKAKAKSALAARFAEADRETETKIKPVKPTETETETKALKVKYEQYES